MESRKLYIIGISPWTKISSDHKLQIDGTEQSMLSNQCTLYHEHISRLLLTKFVLIIHIVVYLPMPVLHLYNRPHPHSCAVWAHWTMLTEAAHSSTSKYSVFVWDWSRKYQEFCDFTNIFSGTTVRFVLILGDIASISQYHCTIYFGKYSV